MLRCGAELSARNGLEQEQVAQDRIPVTRARAMRPERETMTPERPEQVGWAGMDELLSNTEGAEDGLQDSIGRDFSGYFGKDGADPFQADPQQIVGQGIGDIGA